MSRAQRLLDLLQLLRQHRYPVSGAILAAELGISLRTLYRDIATLQQQGAQIDGEPGMGYVLRPGFAPAADVFAGRNRSAGAGCALTATRPLRARDQLAIYPSLMPLPAGRIRIAL